MDKEMERSDTKRDATAGGTMETRPGEEQENTVRKTEGRTVWRPFLSNGKRRRRTQGIYSQRELRELILYERARADRTGHEVSVVLCELNGQASSHRFVADAVHALSRSIRHTDHLGWYDRKSLGVVLPLTSQNGARQFVDSLIQMPDNGHRNVARDLDWSIHSCSDTRLDSREEEGPVSGAWNPQARMPGSSSSSLPRNGVPDHAHEQSTG